MAEPVPSTVADRQGQYVVIARRYRPQTFDDLIGQEHVAQALSNAIATQRVGHAYLFTGARGVGKTSAARILAKALDCVTGPTATPCNQCDICQSISTGDDVDVLEIDGASNRGIDDVRQLRQNVNVRPSRARFKIYIIDEVHMVTRDAFNALLKTLEEPPEHVKFIFCTTEPTKIPITILSRCQRFDFAGIRATSIAQRLQTIVGAEGLSAEPEALELLARRAAGSMRDSQSLLEQLLAFSQGRITTADVHAMLGTAGDQRLGALVGHLAGRNAAAALAELDAAVRDGVDPAQLLEQLFGYFRDCMAAAAGCPADAALYASPAHWTDVAATGKQLGLATILAIMQMLDQTLGRMRVSTQTRVLAELALVRVCQLEDLDALAGLVAQLKSLPSGRLPALPAAPAAALPAAAPPTERTAAPPAPAPGAPGKKNDESAAAGPSTGVNPPPAATATLTAGNALEVWSAALDRVGGMVAEQARLFDRVTLAEPQRLVVAFKSDDTFAKTACERPENAARFAQALAEVTGATVRVEFRVEAVNEPAAAPAPRQTSPHQRLREVSRHPLVERAAELFGAQPVRVDEPANPK